MPLPPPPPPPPPAPPPPPPAAFSAPPPKTKDRAALLQDIQKGRALKKVVTNDRSAPVVDGKSSSSSASAHSRSGPSGGATTSKFPAPPVPTGPTSFADELSRRLGGGGRTLGKNLKNDGGCSATNGSTGSVISSNAGAANANGVSRPLPPPPPPSHASSAPSFSTKPVQSQAPKPPTASVKPMAPQPGRGGAASNGVGRNLNKQTEMVEEDDGRFKGPSVKEQMRAFANVNQATPRPPPVPTLKQRLSVEQGWSNGDCNDDGTYATKAAPPPPPSKPPSKLPHKDSRFHTLNPAKMNKQQGGAIVHIPRSGSHENLPAVDGSYPPAPPPKVLNARSPGAASRPAPPPPGRPPPPPERPQVAPPPPPPPPTAPPPPPAQKSLAQNGRHNVHASRNNEPVLRNAYVDNSPAPPPRCESLMPDLERRFSFLMLHELPAPEDFRGTPKNYGRPMQSQQQRSRAPEPPTHR